MFSSAGAGGKARSLSQDTSALRLLIVSWGVAFLLLHTMISVQVWDRYLLPLAPATALLGGWLAHIAAPVFGRRFGLAVVVGVLLMLPPGLAAARGELPIGGDHGAYSGLHEALAWVKEQGDEPAILYPSPVGMALSILSVRPDSSRAKPNCAGFPVQSILLTMPPKAPHLRKFLVQPHWAPLSDLGMHLSTRGLTAQTRLRTGHFTVMELVPKPESVCIWFSCRSYADLDRTDHATSCDRPAVHAMMSP